MKCTLKFIIMTTLFFPVISYAVVEDCSHNVSFDNGNTYQTVTGRVECVRRREPHIKTRSVGLKAGKKHGKTTLYDGYRSQSNPRNKVISIENYHNGKKHGKFIRYDMKTGKLNNEIDYQHDIKQREISIHPFDGSKTLSFHRKDPQYNWSRKIGSLSYTSAGQLSAKSCPKAASGVAELDKVCGFSGGAQTSKLYNNEGKVVATTVQLKGKTTDQKEYYPSGSIKVSRTPNSQTFFYENGKPREKIVDSPNRSQTVTEYYQNGKKKKQIYTVERKLQTVSGWYMNGKPKFIVERQGKSENMAVKSYHGNGQLFEEYTYLPRDRYSIFFSSFYRSAKLVGNSRTFYKNGKPWEDIRRDAKDILQSARYYFESGQLRKSTQVNNNETKTIVEYNEQGEVEESGIYYADGSLK